MRVNWRAGCYLQLRARAFMCVSTCAFVCNVHARPSSLHCQRFFGLSSANARHEPESARALVRKGKRKAKAKAWIIQSFLLFFFSFLCLARAFASSIQLDLTEWDWLLVWSGLGRASFLFCSFSLSFFFFQIENYFNEQVNSEQETFFVLSMNELHLRFSWTSFERIPTNLICYRRIFVIAFQRKQGRIHGYPSGVRVGRSSAGEGH